MVTPVMSMNSRRPVQYVPPDFRSKNSITAILMTLLLLCIMPVTKTVMKYSVLAILPNFIQSIVADWGTWIFFLTIIIHIGEAFVITLPLLRSKNVSSEIAALWIASVIFEGYPANVRLTAQPSSSSPMAAKHSPKSH